jgi:cyclopropane fatty-acyl-phospholipid synthase-like methyltransferase
MNIQKEKLKILEDLKDVETILDIGCGKGELVNYFLNLNKNVLGIDKKNLEISHQNFNFLNLDIRDYSFDKTFDLIICSLFLHFFMPSGARFLIKKMQENTNINGYNFLVCLSDKDGFSKNNFSHFYPNLDGILSLYSKNWKVVKTFQGESGLEEHDGLKPHKHDVIMVLMQKNK